MDQVVEFVKTAIENGNEIKAISFHGGEPLIYIKRIDEYMERLKPILGNIEVYITTNGSLITDNEWFFEKWNHIHITLSYDFNYQEINRAPIDLKSISEVLYRNNCYLMFQFVIPPDGFHEDTLAEVLRSCKLANCNTLNLIPLRHHRGKQKFKVLIDEIDMKWYSINLMRFVHSLYVNGINLNIDGNYDKIDKQYLNNHGKLIISPDGYLYPEFDYLEYKRKEFRVGKWRNGIVLDRVKSEEDYISSQCSKCTLRDACGLKYLYHMFDEKPKGTCVDFYKTIDLMVKHLHELKKKPTLLHWVGYQNSI